MAYAVVNMDKELAIFLNHLEYDKEFAADNYKNDRRWRECIKRFYEPLRAFDSKLDVAVYSEDKQFLEFLEFIQGNGFYWEIMNIEYWENAELLYDIRIFPKYLTE